MNNDEVVFYLNRRSSSWPRSDFGGPEGKLATLAEHRLGKVLNGRNVVWASGRSTEDADGNVAVSAVVVCEEFIVLDGAKSDGRDVSQQGDTRIAPWSSLSGVTVREYWPASGDQGERARYILHLEGGVDVAVDPAPRNEARGADAALLDLALSRLASR